MYTDKALWVAECICLLSTNTQAQRTEGTKPSPLRPEPPLPRNNLLGCWQNVEWHVVQCADLPLASRSLRGELTLFTSTSSFCFSITLCHFSPEFSLIPHSLILHPFTLLCHVSLYQNHQNMLHCVLTTFLLSPFEFYATLYAFHLSLFFFVLKDLCLCLPFPLYLQ